MARSSIFLSGWEYNRILQSDPIAPVTSGLPAEVLWNGAGQFWLFETVYCTKESLEGDIAASQALGWASGFIFEDLERRGFLKSVSWADLAASSPFLRRDLEATHASLHRSYSISELRGILERGLTHQLEYLKLELMRPILQQLGCIHSASPNSVSAWFRSMGGPEAASPSGSGAVLAQIVSRARLGFRLCDPPGTGVSSVAQRSQKAVERKLERPMIPDLLLGQLPQADYHGCLLSSATVYRPINAQLQSDYRRSIERLERLRDLAATHLWPSLHREWLPRLENEPNFRAEFGRLLRDAALSATFEPYLSRVTSTAITVVSAGIGLATLLIGQQLGADTVTASTAGAATGTIAKDNLGRVLDERKTQITPLTLFYQKARKT